MRKIKMQIRLTHEEEKSKDRVVLRLERKAGSSLEVAILK